jgi:hypothetical protein
MPDKVELIPHQRKECRLIVTFGEAVARVFVFQTVMGHGPFLGSAPVNALKPRCSLKYRHQK